MTSTVNYCNVIDVKSEIGKITGGHDDLIERIIIPAASRAIDNYCNREKYGFVSSSTASAKQFAGKGEAYLYIDECTAITLVEVKDSATDSTYTSWATSDWIAFSGDKEDPDFDRIPYTAIMANPTGSYSLFTSGRFNYRRGFKPFSESNVAVPTVRVTAKWGYATSVPSVIKQACIAQTARWYKRGESAWSDILASNEMGNALFQIRQELDGDIKMMLIGGRFFIPSL